MAGSTLKLDQTLQIGLVASPIRLGDSRQRPVRVAVLRRGQARRHVQFVIEFQIPRALTTGSDRPKLRMIAIEAPDVGEWFAELSALPRHVLLEIAMALNAVAIREMNQGSVAAA